MSCEVHRQGQRNLTIPLRCVRSYRKDLTIGLLLFYIDLLLFSSGHVDKEKIKEAFQAGMSFKLVLVSVSKHKTFDREPKLTFLEAYGHFV